jgi:hypothetical protein
MSFYDANGVPLFGLEIAVKKLRPGARFCFESPPARFTAWWDPDDRPAPTLSEIYTQIALDEADRKEVLKRLRLEKEALAQKQIANGSINIID